MISKLILLSFQNRVSKIIMKDLSSLFPLFSTLKLTLKYDQELLVRDNLKGNVYNKIKINKNKLNIIKLTVTDFLIPKIIEASNNCSYISRFDLMSSRILINNSPCSTLFTHI